jgi:hypothetical protein
MNNLNDTLPDLMRRATDGLEPESTDLVERGMQRGVTLRRRRTALLSVSGAGAVLATAGIVFGGSQLLGSHAGSEAPVAGGLTSVSKGSGEKPPAVTPKETLATLRKVLPTGLKVSQPRSWGGGINRFNGASVVVDDGKGAAMVSTLVQTAVPTKICALTGTGQCIVRADGSVVVSLTETPEYSKNGNPGGVVSNYVEIYRPNGTMIALTSYNGPKEKGAAHTRPKPALSVAKLISMGDSKLWKFPAESKVWPSPTPVAVPPGSPSAADKSAVKAKELEAKESPTPVPVSSGRTDQPNGK